jgi:dipeptidyl aminopeptidase/acylaminoacyl peptidase
MFAEATTSEVPMSMLRVARATAGLLAVAGAVGVHRLSAQGAPRVTPATDRVTLEQYMDLEEVQAPRLAPDGRQVIYTRRWIDKLNDRWESALWMVNSDGSRNRFLVKGSGAIWSPDGARIAYVASAGEGTTPQIFTRWMDAEGATSQVTRVEQAPADVEWSPDGKWLLFSMNESVPSPSAVRIKMPEAPKGAKWTAPPTVVTRLKWRADRQGIFPDAYRQLWVVPSNGGAPRRLTSGPWNHTDPHWTPDGKSVLFTSHRVPDAEFWARESEIYEVNVASGDIRQLTHHPGPDAAPRPSPDGKLIAFTSHDSTDDTHRETSLFVMSADGSGRRELTKGLDRSPLNLQWAEDGSGIYFNVQDRGNQDLYFAPIAGGYSAITTPATAGKMHVLTVTDVDRAGRAVGTFTSPIKSPNVVTFSVREPAKMTTLTQVNDDQLANKKLGETEEIWYASKDGKKVQGWIIKPPDFDPSKKYPLILTIHGGPHSMDNTAFKFPWQLHAAQGYVVLYTNPRGSTGYGSAFANAIKNAWPGPDFDDLMVGVDSVIGRGYIDQRNLFVYGCSGGGTMTAWVVGHTDRFAAAVAQCPITDMVSMVGTTDVFWYGNFQHFPWDDPAEHLRRSPIMYVGHAKTPTMIMTGVNDLRTPVEQAEEFYEALRVRKVPTELIRFNNEWHGTSSTPSNFLRTQLYLMAWFEKWGSKKPGVTN